MCIFIFTGADAIPGCRDAIVETRLIASLREYIFTITVRPGMDIGYIIKFNGSIKFGNLKNQVKNV